MQRLCHQHVCGLLFLLSFSAQGQTAPTPTPTPDTTKAIMERIRENIEVLLPLSSNRAAFTDPAKKSEIMAALKALADSSAVLQVHGQDQNRSFRYFSRSLARDVNEAFSRFQEGKLDQSQYLVAHLSDDCIACHTRLSKSGSNAGEKLFPRIDVSTISLHEKAKLLTALHQTSLALQTFETLLSSSIEDLKKAGIDNVLHEYLVLIIRQQFDLQRAEKTLKAFVKRDGIPIHVQHNVEHWPESISFLKKGPTPTNSIG